MSHKKAVVLHSGYNAGDAFICSQSSCCHDLPLVLLHRVYPACIKCTRNTSHNIFCLFRFFDAIHSVVVCTGSGILHVF